MSAKLFMQVGPFGIDLITCQFLIYCPDIKHDNILFRPKGLVDVVAHELINSPSVTYDCGTEKSPPVIPVVSQPLPPTSDKVIPETDLEAVLADVGHCTYIFASLKGYSDLIRFEFSTLETSSCPRNYPTCRTSSPGGHPRL